MKRIFQIAVVTLCAFVFAWGLQYKLSLYEAPVTTSVPAAKLLAGKSDVTLKDATPISKPSLGPVLSFSLLFLLAHRADDQKFLMYRASLSAFMRFGRSLELAHLSRFAFRPPPSLV